MSCQITGCKGLGQLDKKGNRLYLKNYCQRHYYNFKKYGDALNPKRYKLGQTKHYLYSTYNGMKNRCYNPKDKFFKDYGKRGINICDRWLGRDGFINFVKDMGDKPSKLYTIDRIDNDKGYSPDNCRWVLQTYQNYNTRTAKKAKGYYKVANKYRVIIGNKNKTINIGYFDTEAEAKAAYLKAKEKYLMEVL